MIAVKETVCETCGACIGVCPVDAISMGSAAVIIDRDTCINCGACVRVCPVAALEPVEERMPD